MSSSPSRQFAKAPAQSETDIIQPSHSYKTVESELATIRNCSISPNYSPDFGYFRQARWVGRIDGGVLI